MRFFKGLRKPKANTIPKKGRRLTLGGKTAIGIVSKAVRNLPLLLTYLSLLKRATSNTPNLSLQPTRLNNS